MLLLYEVQITEVRQMKKILLAISLIMAVSANYVLEPIQENCIQKKFGVLSYEKSNY